LLGRDAELFTPEDRVHEVREAVRVRVAEGALEILLDHVVAVVPALEERRRVAGGARLAAEELEVPAGTLGLVCRPADLEGERRAVLELDQRRGRVLDVEAVLGPVRVT